MNHEIAYIRQWGTVWVYVCVNVNRGCTTPNGGVNNSLLLNLTPKLNQKRFSKPKAGFKPMLRLNLSLVLS